jgi:cbb3-type cytochrome oxidase subunit 3
MNIFKTWGTTPLGLQVMIKKLSFFKTLALLIFLFLLICVIYSKTTKNEDDYVARKIENNELIGRWYCTDETLEKLRKEGANTKYLSKKDNVLLLNPDGFECNITLPNIADKEQDNFSLSGKWLIHCALNGKLYQYTLILNTEEMKPCIRKISLLNFYISINRNILQLRMYYAGNASSVYIFEKCKSN